MYFAILWHHHQPIYRDPESGHYLLPYVNYHLTKNYYPMALLAEECAFPCIFNLVPCLIKQIIESSQGKARDSLQEALEKDPGRLTREEAAFLTRFLPRGQKEEDRAKLQVSVLQHLFSPATPVPADKESLLKLQKSISREVLPLYKRLWLERRVELTTSAYYHPLLPLLFDLAVGGEPIMPAFPFRYPEDARAQIEKGREYFRQVFGQCPVGFWPSEGGISQEVAEAVAKSGFSYAVTDENILWKSLGKNPTPLALSKPYACQNLAIFFRDRELSDLISFEYQRWDEKDAIRHFLGKLEDRMRTRPEEGICVIALDGENPWAGYKDNGVPFLREFYSQLQKKEGLKPILLRDYLSLAPPQEEIRLVPGTWLGNFSRWVGHPAKNAAWEKLALVRQRCGPREEIFVAEGSDWFWWFGEGAEAEFHRLFEAYLKCACRPDEKERTHV